MEKEGDHVTFKVKNQTNISPKLKFKHMSLKDNGNLIQVGILYIVM